MLRLEYLKVIGHPQLGDLELYFTEENEIKEDGNPYKSVIIGPNGTGKSYILRTIIDLFREMNELKSVGKRKKYVTGHYLLKYVIDDDRYSYGNIYEKKDGANPSSIGPMVPGGRQWRERGKEFFISKNDTSIKTYEIELPDAILANSIMLSDKFLFLSDPKEFSQYKYLGIRVTNSSAGTKSLIKNTVNLLANSTNNKLIISKLPSVLEFLELQRYLVISYRAKRRNIFFTGKLSKEIVVEFINKYETRRDAKIIGEGLDTPTMFSFRKYKEILNNEDTLNTFIEFCNNKSADFEKDNFNPDFTIKYDIIDDLETFKSEYEMIALLGRLDLIEYPQLSLRKSEKDIYGFNGASSGESHFLNSAISILATIKDNSVVLIDEPEISLHPNWQMKYMEFLREAFQGFESCQFIIATHSHFLISDLKGENSKIIGLKRENGKIEIVNMPPNIDTFGWSAEDVLYRVFGVRTTRNYYMEVELRTLLHLISEKSEDKNSLLQITGRLERVILNHEDPLNLILKKAQDYIVKL